MTLKLALVRANSFYFCGKVALSVKNTENNPITVDYKSLNEKEIIGLVRAIKTNVIKAVEGEETLISMFKEIDGKRKVKKEITDEVQVATTEVEVKEPEVIVEKQIVIEEEKTSEKEDIKEEEKSEVIEEVVKEEVVKKVATPKRTTTKKVTK